MLISAGLAVHRSTSTAPEVLLGHPGGPLWSSRDLGAWTIPKGAIQADEDPLAAALREFSEETGLTVSGVFRPLRPVRQSGGKRVLAWAVEADLDLTSFSPGRFEMEWPPRSGRIGSFPELDRIAFLGVREAVARILAAQQPLVLEATGDRPADIKDGEKMIDLNAATAQDLDAVPQLKGHGYEIVRYREERGRFEEVRQLEEVPGLAGKWDCAEAAICIG